MEMEQPIPLQVAVGHFAEGFPNPNPSISGLVGGSFDLLGCMVLMIWIDDHFDRIDLPEAIWS